MTETQRAASALGRARWKNTTPEQRTEAARKAALARWEKADKDRLPEDKQPVSVQKSRAANRAAAK